MVLHIYRESNFLAQYIDANTKSRAAAKNEFEKDFYKLMNNSVFGKTLETDPRLRLLTDVKLTP